MTERRPSVGRASALLGTLIALTVIGSSAVAVALPVLGEELGIDFGGRAWVLAAFSLAFATTTAFFGRLADVVGLRLPLRIGVALFSAGSLVAAAAPGFAPLLLGRLLQGVGAGAVPVIATGVIAAVFDEEQRPRAFGGLTSVVALVSGCGPLIGGGIAALGGWRPVLGLPAVALLLLVPVERLVPAGRPPGTERLDLRGALLTAGVVIGVVLLLQAPATGAGPAVVLAAAGLALGSVALLARHVSRHPEGFLPRVLLRDRRLVLTAVTGPLLLAPYFGLLLAAPQLLRDDRGWTPLQIGLALLPAAAAGAVCSRVAGAALTRIAPARIAAVAAVGSVAGLLVAAAGAPRPVPLVAGLACASCGFAAGQVALLDSVTRMVGPELRGVAIGVFNLVFFTGASLGSAGTGGLASLLGLPGALAVLALVPACAVVTALATERASAAERPRR